MNSRFILGQVTGDALSMAMLLGHSDELHHGNTIVTRGALLPLCTRLTVTRRVYWFVFLPLNVKCRWGIIVPLGECCAAQRFSPGDSGFLYKCCFFGRRARGQHFECEVVIVEIPQKASATR
jgi:hypothetical protein